MSKKSKAKTNTQEPNKYGHLKPTRENLKQGAAPRGRNRGRQRL